MPSPKRSLQNGNWPRSQKACEFLLEGTVKAVGIASDGLETDQQSAHEQTRQAGRDHRGTEQPPEGPRHQSGILIPGERPAFPSRYHDVRNSDLEQAGFLPREFASLAR